MLFLVFLVALVMVCLVLFSVPSCTTDYDSPLNMFMYQAPVAARFANNSERYSDQMVNLWVTKTWRTDGKRIPCRLEEGYKPSVPNRDRKLILYSHGNAEDILSCAQFVRELAQSVKMDVVCWDYSGYGLNEPDKFERSPEGVNLSLKTILDTLIAPEKGYQLENIILWGYSLGSGPSVQLAASLGAQNRTILGLVLFGAYSSILDVVRENTHPQIASMFSERWNNRETIPNVRCPILIMHGQSDGMIRYTHAEALKAANPAAKLVLLPNTGHTRFSWSEAVKEVRRWMSENNIDS